MTDFLSELWIGLLVAVVLGVLGLVWRAIVQTIRSGDIDLTELQWPISPRRRANIISGVLGEHATSSTG